jgi:hypothetical protein
MKLRWNSRKLSSLSSSPQTLSPLNPTLSLGGRTQRQQPMVMRPMRSINTRTTLTHNKETTVNKKCNEPGGEDKLTSENGDSQTTQHMLTEEQRPTPSLPTIEPLPYSLESELTGVPMTASMTPTEAEGSSSVEPEWGRTRQKSAKEVEDEWQAWETTNTKKTTTDRKSGRRMESMEHPQIIQARSLLPVPQTCNHQVARRRLRLSMPRVHFI